MYQEEEEEAKNKQSKQFSKLPAAVFLSPRMIDVFDFVEFQPP